MKNRKSLLIHIFTSKKENNVIGYLADWLGFSGFHIDPDLPYTHVYSVHHFKCPMVGHSLFKMEKINVVFNIIYNISDSDMITSSIVIPKKEYGRYEKTISEYFTHSKDDIDSIITKNMDIYRQKGEIEFDFKKEVCLESTTRIVEENISKYNIRSKVSYNMSSYSDEWNLSIRNHIAKFTVRKSRNNSTFYVEVKVLTTDEQMKSSFYKILKERPRAKGEFTISPTIDELFKMISRVELIGTPDEPYDAKYDKQTEFKFSRSKNMAEATATKDVCGAEDPHKVEWKKSRKDAIIRRVMNKVVKMNDDDKDKYRSNK